MKFLATTALALTMMGVVATAGSVTFQPPTQPVISIPVASSGDGLYMGVSVGVTSFSGMYFFDSENTYGWEEAKIVELSGQSLGGYIGYGKHIGTSRFYIAGEVGADFLNSSYTDDSFHGDCVEVGAEIYSTFTTTLRLGYDISNKVMVYSHAGVAGATTSASVGWSGPSQSYVANTESGFLTGTVWGVGAEVATSPHGSIRVEVGIYNFRDLTIGGIPASGGAGARDTSSVVSFDHSQVTIGYTRQF